MKAPLIPHPSSFIPHPSSFRPHPSAFILPMLESPWPILIVGLVFEAVLAIALFRTGRGVILGLMGGVALLVLLGVLVERWTVTDTKRIRQTLGAAAAGLQANSAKQASAS